VPGSHGPQRLGPKSLPIDHGIDDRGVRHLVPLGHAEPWQHVPVEVVAFDDCTPRSKRDCGCQDRLTRTAWAVNGYHDRPVNSRLALGSQLEDG
jgi:hypothetical protein